MKEAYLVLFCMIILLGGCIQQVEETDSGLTDLKEENSKLKEDIKELETQITNLKNELTTVTEERDKYLKELDEFYLTKITGTIDLMYWDDNDMIRALADYNNKFKDASFKVYVYRLDKKDFYWALGGEFTPDPFFELRRKNQDQELNVSHLRIERLAINNNATLAKDSFDEYYQDILKETQIDKELICYQQTTCRDIKVIKCVKDNKDMYVWFEGTHMFTSRFDGREALDTFEKFYCYSTPGSMTTIS